jgi:hypothetical protein
MASRNSCKWEDGQAGAGAVSQAVTSWRPGTLVEAGAGSKHMVSQLLISQRAGDKFEGKSVVQAVSKQSVSLSVTIVVGSHGLKEILL